MIGYPNHVLAAGSDEDVTLLRAAEAAELYRVVADWHSDDAVRLIRGDKMTTWGALYDEVSAAFQFPLYFGRNLAALTESWSEPDQEPVRGPRLCVIVGAEFVLSAEASKDLQKLVHSLQVVRRNWREHPPELEPGVSPVFSVVIVPLSGDETVIESLRERWVGAGAAVREYWVDG